MRFLVVLAVICLLTSALGYGAYRRLPPSIGHNNRERYDNRSNRGPVEFPRSG